MWKTFLNSLYNSIDYDINSFKIVLLVLYFIKDSFEMGKDLIVINNKKNLLSEKYFTAFSFPSYSHSAFRFFLKGWCLKVRDNLESIIVRALNGKILKVNPCWPVKAKSLPERLSVIDTALGSGFCFRNCISFLLLSFCCLESDERKTELF